MGALIGAIFYARAQASVQIDSDWDKALMFTTNASQHAEDLVVVTRQQMNRVLRELKYDAVDVVHASGSEISKIMGTAYNYAGELVDQVNSRNVEVIEVGAKEVKLVSEALAKSTNNVVGNFHEEFRSSLEELERPMLL